ncbi:hypothetical protein [Halobacillus ihumii]|uniref:hypothetical protein n=1 Tax=Halobacillus ihumii TaxID=2686092 RepID=UPI0013D196A4|nr:hypothetical protein [Halobacillus ihumii]
MSKEMKEMEDMPVWQDHERRITTLENTFSTFSTKVDNVEKTIKEQGNIQKQQNDEQKKLLNTLIDHHLSTNKMKVSNFWKVILNITGAGGIITAIFYALVQLLA